MDTALQIDRILSLEDQLKIKTKECDKLKLEKLTLKKMNNIQVKEIFKKDDLNMD